MVVASAKADSGRFRASDEDLSDTEVDEGGGEAPRLSANVRESTVDESSNFEVIATSDATGPTLWPSPFGGVSTVGRTHSDGRAASRQQGIEPSEVESDVESIPLFDQDDTFDEHSSPVEEDMPIVDLMIGAAARAALQGLDDVDLEAEFCTRACVMKSPPGFLANSRFPEYLLFSTSRWVSFHHQHADISNECHKCIRSVTTTHGMMPIIT